MPAPPLHIVQRLYQAEELVRRRRADEYRRQVASQRAARIDPNPHQIDAVMFALERLPDGGCILADEVGLGKTTEAGLVIAQVLAEATGIHAAGDLRSIGALSAGTQDQLATLLRLCIAEQLHSAIVLDDHLTHSDASRIDWFNAVLRGAARQVQIILITCRPAEVLTPTEFPRVGEVAHAGAAGLLRAVDLGAVIHRFATPVPPRAHAQQPG